MKSTNQVMKLMSFLKRVKRKTITYIEKGYDIPGKSPLYTLSIRASIANTNNWSNLVQVNFTR